MGRGHCPKVLTGWSLSGQLHELPSQCTQTDSLKVTSQDKQNNSPVDILVDIKQEQTCCSIVGYLTALKPVM